MFKFLIDVADVIVKTATLPVSIALDSTLIPPMLGTSVTGKNMEAIEKAIDEIGKERHQQ